MRYVHYLDIPETVDLSNGASPVPYMNLRILGAPHPAYGRDDVES